MTYTKAEREKPSFRLSRAEQKLKGSGATGPRVAPIGMGIRICT